jgi:hypothetical protein
MSIYATQWQLKFPEDGFEYPGCKWILVTAQGVPSHIGSPTPGSGYEQGDPYGDFLPPPVEDAPDTFQLRAVVFVTEATKKGTTRSGQEYENPLLVMPGDEYLSMNFNAVYHRICDALSHGKRRPSAIKSLSDGKLLVIFDNGDCREVARDEWESDND